MKEGVLQRPLLTIAALLLLPALACNISVNLGQGQPQQTEMPPGNLKIVFFQAQPPRIGPGECALLRWEVGPADLAERVSLYGAGVPAGNVAPIGEREVCPSKTTEYHLVAFQRGGGVQEASGVVEVVGTEAPPPAPPTKPAPSAGPTSTAPSAGPTPTTPPAGTTKPPPPPPPPATGGLEADVTPTDIYPDNLPQGNLWVRITNNGPDELQGQQVELTMVANGPGQGTIPPPQTVTLNLAPGETMEYNTGVPVDSSIGDWDVTVTIKVLGFTDPKPGNNSYHEKIAKTAPTADIAVTDLFPNNLPQGEVYVRLTNNGPDSLTNATVQLACSAVATVYVGGAESTIGVAPGTITVSLNPGQTEEFDTHISVDTSKQWYQVNCTAVGTDFTDNNGNNNSYSEAIPPPP